MKAAVIREFGGPEVFSYEDVPTPDPREDHVLVRVSGCGINRYDLYLRMGTLRTDQPKPHVMGADVAGNIEAVGPNVTSFSEGDRVIVAPGFPTKKEEWNYQPTNQAPSYTVTGTILWGGNAQYIEVPAQFCFPDPTDLPQHEVAAVPLVLVTAVHAVKTLGEVGPGKHVLVSAGASGSGSMCIQVAKVLGADVATVVGSPEKIETAQSAGADLVIEYKRENVADRVMEWTDGKGVETVIDMVGAAFFETNLKVLKIGGIFVNFGLVGGMETKLNFRDLFFGQFQLRGSMMGTTDEFREGLGMLGTGMIKPIVDKTYPLKDVGAAHQYIQDKKVKGKVVLLPWAS